jgi:hypothetical protein
MTMGETYLRPDTLSEIAILRQTYFGGGESSLLMTKAKSGFRPE